jgi:hypothetical protein
MGVEQFVMGMASWFEYFGKHIWKSTQDIFGELKVKITIKSILMVMLSIT